MVLTMLDYFIGKVGSFFAWLSGLTLVEGVTLLGFLIALFLVGVMIRNFLFTAR